MATMAAAGPAGSEAAAAASGGAVAESDPLLQYVVLRRDLWTELDWPLGSLVAQGCHAATAALWMTREAATTQQYCAPENIDHMHKASRPGWGGLQKWGAEESAGMWGSLTAGRGSWCGLGGDAPGSIEHPRLLPSDLTARRVACTGRR